MSRKPTIAELEQIFEEEKDIPIEILPNGEVRELGGSSAADTGRLKPITMKEDLGGEYTNMGRLGQDIQKARDSFHNIETFEDRQGNPYIKVALQANQRAYIVRISCDGYPNRAPSVSVVSPQLPQHMAFEHRFNDDRICYMHPNRWNPGRHDITFVVARAAKWLHKYEVYRATGRWPGASIAH